MHRNTPPKGLTVEQISPYGVACGKIRRDHQRALRKERAILKKANAGQDPLWPEDHIDRQKQPDM